MVRKGDSKCDLLWELMLNAYRPICSIHIRTNLLKLLRLGQSFLTLAATQLKLPVYSVLPLNIHSSHHLILYGEFKRPNLTRGLLN
ncbi:hypothetical protein XENTR_v10011571 [Xenopus tropicalis]|nr:hypothetical protein XENTR_v10011571 [Xenopus tropicalis]